MDGPLPNYAGRVTVDGSGGLGDEGATVELAVTGMHCQSCASLIEETLLEEPGVRSASVELEGALASVTYDPAVRSVGDLCAAVAGLGYSAAPAGAGDPVP